MSVMMTVECVLQRFCWSDRKIVPEILIPQLYVLKTPLDESKQILITLINSMVFK
jgi:hypothetical protein